MLKSLKFWIVALVAAVFFLGCSQGASDDEALGSAKMLGRYTVENFADGTRLIHMGWPGSGFALRYEGEGLLVSIKDDGRGIMDLRVNGVDSTIKLKKGLHEYRLVEADTFGVFDVRLTRRSEFYDTGLFSISVITNDSRTMGSYKALKLPLKDRKILFLGDSITAGFGVGGDTKDCLNTPALHSPTESYAMLTADMFGAEPHLIAISGRGVVHNWDANPAPVMPAQIDFALPDDSDGPDWDHSLFTPDVVVTLLGTNDWSVINPGQERFRKGYRDMLSDLRTRFPKAHIVTVGGPLLDEEKAAAARDGIDWAMSELQDSNISTLDLTLYNGLLKWSCNYHPGRNSMRKMANELSAHIAAVKGWTYEPLKLPKAHPIAPPNYMLEGGKAHFNTRLPQIDAQPVLKGGVLLAGDSITEGWLGYDIDLGATVSNHGVSWDTVTGLKLRLPQILAHSSDKIFILIGTNDIGYDRDPQIMVDELSEIISAINNESPKTKIYIQSLLPRELSAMGAVKEINASYARLALEMGVNYIDLTPIFSAPDGTLKADLTYDGLHLNEMGYKVWAETLKPYIQN